MKIVLIGAGKVGRAIIKYLCQEGHEIVVIDEDSNIIDEIINEFDVMGIAGSGTSYEIQKEAHVDRADLVVAVTSSDENNLLVCIMAKKLGAKETIARVRGVEYYNHVDWFQKEFGLAMTINPELESAKEIQNILNFPEALRVDSLANGKVDLVELYIPSNSPLIGKSLIDIHNKYQVKVLVCAVQRGEDVFIPTGKFTFMEHDRIHITASREMVRIFLNKLGLISNRIKNVIIIGGSKIAVYLTEALIKTGFNVKIIDTDVNKCLELTEMLPKATIIHGDASDQTLLLEEGIETCDSLISLTGLDEENIIVSMFANKVNVPKVIAKVNKPSLSNLLEAIGGLSIISPKEITASKIVSYVRSNSNEKGSNLITLYKLVNNKVEVLEFKANNDFESISIPLKDLKIKNKILIATIIRDDDVIIPNGLDVIMPGDRVVIVTTGVILDSLSDILE